MSANGMNGHGAAETAASAARWRTPPFFIAAGRCKSSNCLSSIDGTITNPPRGIMAKSGHKGWIPAEGDIADSKNGSMKGPLLASFVYHLDHTACKLVQTEESELLCLDGRNSRKIIKGLNYCMDHSIEAELNATNTSHSVQTCNQDIHRTFHQILREISDEVFMKGYKDTTKDNFNISCAIFARENLNTSIVNS